MKVLEPMADLRLIELDIYHDHRGFFMERFNEKKFSSLNLPSTFIQDNHSRSRPNVLRGLHFQNFQPQGKLIGVLSGHIWDVALDLRPESKTFGKYFSVELSESNGCLLWMPKGFAHGFCVLGSQEADVLYKVDAPYFPKGDDGIIWNDSELKIPWPVKAPILSQKDAELGSFADWKKKLGLNSNETRRRTG